MAESNARIPSVHIGQFEPVPPDVIALIPLSLIQKQKIIPLKRFPNHLLVAAPKTSDIIKPEGLSMVVGCPVEVVMAPLDEIDTFIKRHYASSKAVPKKMMVVPAELIVPAEPPPDNRISLIVGGPMPDLVEAAPTEAPPVPSFNFLVPEAETPASVDESIDETVAAHVTPAEPPKPTPDFEAIFPDPTPTPAAAEPKIIPPEPNNLVESPDPGLPSEFVTVMTEASITRASEILVSIKGDRYDLRQRIRGTLVPMKIGQGGLYPSQIEKLVAWVASVGERQFAGDLEWFDVRKELKLGETLYSCQAYLTFTRKSKILTFRICSQKAGLFSPGTWGMDQTQVKLFTDLLNARQGVLLFVGSDRDDISNNMNASARHLALSNRHVMAVEPSLESWMAEVDHFSTKGDAATMENFLNKIFQHAPDVVVVNPLSEKRHFEQSLRESLNGSLVLARTLATDAIEGLYQVLSLGVEPFLVSSAILGVVAKRTIRLNCPNCQIKDTAAKSAVKDAGIPDALVPPFFFMSKGCEACSGTGFSGEADVFEVLNLTPDLKNILTRDVRIETLRAHATTAGFLTLRQLAVRKAINGQTSLAEVLRSTPK